MRLEIFDLAFYAHALVARPLLFLEVERRDFELDSRVWGEMSREAGSSEQWNLHGIPVLFEHSKGSGPVEETFQSI